MNMCIVGECVHTGMCTGLKGSYNIYNIKGLGSYGNECTRARIQLPRPMKEKVRKGDKGEYKSVMGYSHDRQIHVHRKVAMVFYL